MSTLQDFLAFQSDQVRSNVRIITPEDIGQDYFLHISPHPMEKKGYTPFIGFRQGPNEDRTLPRVTVAPHLLGCITGYAQLVWDILDRQVNKSDYRQGWYIHKIPFTEALKPTKKLVYDANYTEEHWLVRYNENTTHYPCQRIGQFFCHRLIKKPKAGNKVPDEVTLELYCKLDNKLGINFNRILKIDQPYSRITFNYEENTVLPLTDSDHTHIEPISSTEYFSQKKLQASLLSFEEPLTKKWT